MKVEIEFFNTRDKRPDFDEEGVAKKVLFWSPKGYLESGYCRQYNIGCGGAYYYEWLNGFDLFEDEEIEWWTYWPEKPE